MHLLFPGTHEVFKSQIADTAVIFIDWHRLYPFQYLTANILALENIDRLTRATIWQLPLISAFVHALS